MGHCLCSRAGHQSCRNSKFSPGALTLQEMETVDLVIIGAELEALSVLDRLSSAVLERTLVVDPSGAWLGRLEAWIRRLAPALLRDPATLHAAKTPTALRSFAEKRSRGEVRVSRRRGAMSTAGRCRIAPR